jgi:N-acetylneuraminate synthase
MEPDDFRSLAAGLRDIWQMLDHPVDKDDLAPFGEMKRVFQKSVVTARPIAAGTVLGRADLAFKKPGDGISAADYAAIIGRRVHRDLAADHKLSLQDLA